MNTAPDAISITLQMLMALAIVLGGLLVVFYLLKRFLRKEGGGSGNPLIRVIASQYIGIKKNIALVEVAVRGDDDCYPGVDSVAISNGDVANLDAVNVGDRIQWARRQYSRLDSEIAGARFFSGHGRCRDHDGDQSGNTPDLSQWRRWTL